MKINEIFTSVQGEGYLQGQPAIFIRTSGCPNKCTFCDTLHDTYTEFTPKEIVDMVKNASNADVTRLVVLTGGEPMMQPMGDLKELITLLVEDRRTIQIETSGAGISAHLFKQAYPREVFVTMSPKIATAALTTYVASEYKYLYPFPGLPIERHYRAMVETIKYTRNGIITIQPLTVLGSTEEAKTINKRRLQEAYEFAIMRGHIFSPRLHIMLGFK